MPIARLITASILFAAALSAQSLTGSWDCTVTVNGNEIPFRMEFSANGAAVKGNFFNGDERVPSTGGQLREGALRLNFDQYASRLEATLTEGGLEGRYGRESRWSPFRAHRAAAPAPASGPDGVPDIGGLWEIPTKSPKGESAWRFIVSQKGAEVSAAILRVDGDTGALDGRWRDGKFVLSHFSGARPRQPPRPRARRARRPLPPHRRQGRLRAFRLRLPRSGGPHRIAGRCALSRQGGGTGHLRQLVPQLPRRGAVPGRT